MIEVRNINKYFNKNKNNEIHVINNTSLEFPKTGLVCLLGASGSGKTTLLNVVGGLDKIDNGEIIFKDYTIKKYKASQWDSIRNRHFGYIFQNYVLLPEITVYENLELVLKILNLEKAEIDKRIDYALDAVGMLKYKKRKPTQLSGGQQQRIAIARALVKSPDVVIADEPTGNLDERNSTQIMNIIKKISKECLVILVTHERRLAEFYGDRIIEISDGSVISDNNVVSSNDYREIDNQNIYLQEFQNEVSATDDLSVKYFYQSEKPKIVLNIIYKDNTVYIQAQDNNLKIKFLDKANEIKVIDAKKPVIRQDQVESFDYHLEKIKFNLKTKDSVIKFKDSLKMAFKHLGGLRKRQKLLFVIMFLATIMIAIGFTNLFSATHVDIDSYLYFNKNIILVDQDYDNIKEYLTEADKILLHPSSQMVFSFQNGPLRQTGANISLSNPKTYTVTNSLIPIEIIKEPDIVIGRLPNNNNEAVIDLFLVNKYLTYQSIINAGIKYPEQFIGLTFSSNNGGWYRENQELYKIVGIIDNDNPNIYVKETAYKLSVATYGLGNYYYNLTQNYFDKDEIEEYYPINAQGNISETLVSSSTLILKDNQVLVDRSAFEYLKNSNNFDNSKNIYLGFNTNVEIVGITPTISIFGGNLYGSSEFIDKYYLNCTISSTYYDSISIYTPNPSKLIKTLEDNGFKANSIYDRTYEEALLDTLDISLLIGSIIILIASLIFLFFLMRSSLMARIYQVGVYRALGIKKSNIYKIFLTEIFVISAITAALALGVVGYVVNKINDLLPIIFYPWYITPISFIFVMLINTFVGLLPINSLLRLTPSQILSKYDI